MSDLIITPPEPAIVPAMLQNIDSLQVEYPQAIDFANQQLKIFWLPEEVKVEKDIQDILVNLHPSEKHGVITNLKLFTKYEIKAGDEYWGGRFRNSFKRHEFQRMASTFCTFELAIHKPFYSKINELLHLDTDEFYNSYTDDPILKARMKFIDDVINDPDDLISLAGFSMVEGAILYSSFAFLKHFQSQGKNKILNIVRGINFSVRDETLHAKAGAWMFKTLLSQMKIGAERLKALIAKVMAMAQALYEHECHIVDLTFSQGTIEGITALQMKHFVQSRINICLQELGFEKMFEVKYNPIAEWFYKSATTFTYNDTFSGVGNSYHRNWDQTAFTWANIK